MVQSVITSIKAFSRLSGPYFFSGPLEGANRKGGRRISNTAQISSKVSWREGGGRLIKNFKF